MIKNSPVAKHMNKFNKPATHRDRKNHYSRKNKYKKNNRLYTLDHYD